MEAKKYRKTAWELAHIVWPIWNRHTPSTLGLIDTCLQWMFYSAICWMMGVYKHKMKHCHLSILQICEKTASVRSMHVVMVCQGYINFKYTCAQVILKMTAFYFYRCATYAFWRNYFLYYSKMLPLGMIKCSNPFF